jgi:hypothetical protein
MTNPVPGMTYPQPITWSAGEAITTPRLRGDMTNLASLFATGRPLVTGANVGQGLSIGQNLINFEITYANNWNVNVVNSGGSNPTYTIPFTGWWLVQCNATASPPATTPNNDKLSVGFSAVINGAGAATSDGGATAPSTATASTDYVGMYGADLYQFNTATSDTIAWYVYVSAATTSNATMMMAEWICLPTSGLTNWSEYGTVVSSPQALAPFAPGPGTYLPNGVSAGATSVTVESNTGMVVGGTLGLDVVNGQLYQPVGEAVTISSVSGTTIGISACAYAHAVNAPVAVPVSAAFLNQQCRDVINFLSYPPILRVVTSSTQALSGATFPASSAQVVDWGTPTVDNFSGFSSSAYTVPVAGVYYVYGQVYFAGSTSAFGYGAGISVSGGTVQWGNVQRADSTAGAQSYCATVVRHLRLTAGQTITLYATVTTAMSTVASSSDHSRLICIWRGQ